MKLNRSARKALHIFTIISAATALALMVWAGIRVWRFVSDYGEIRGREITEQEVEQLETASRAAASRLAEKERETAMLKERLAALTDVKQAGTEEQIRACYEAREEAVLTAKGLAADALQKAHYITLTPEQQESFGSVFIDEVTGNAVLAGGVKAAIQAASEEKPLGDILSDAAAGAFSGVQDYVQGEIQGMLSDAIGFDVFGVADFVYAYKNASDLPVSLINCMVTAQRRDVYRLSLFLEQEELSGADLQTMAALMERIGRRRQEIAAAGGQAAEFGGAVQLAQLAIVWERNNYQILRYAGAGGGTDED